MITEPDVVRGSSLMVQFGCYDFSSEVLDPTSRDIDYSRFTRPASSASTSTFFHRKRMTRKTPCGMAKGTMTLISHRLIIPHGIVDLVREVMRQARRYLDEKQQFDSG